MLACRECGVCVSVRVSVRVCVLSINQIVPLTFRPLLLLLQVVSPRLKLNNRICNANRLLPKRHFIPPFDNIHQRGNFIWHTENERTGFVGHRESSRDSAKRKNQQSNLLRLRNTVHTKTLPYSTNGRIKHKVWEP